MCTVRFYDGSQSVSLQHVQSLASFCLDISKMKMLFLLLTRQGFRPTVWGKEGNQFEPENQKGEVRIKWIKGLLSWHRFLSAKVFKVELHKLEILLKCLFV